MISMMNEVIIHVNLLILRRMSKTKSGLVCLPISLERVLSYNIWACLMNLLDKEIFGLLLTFFSPKTFVVPRCHLKLLQKLLDFYASSNWVSLQDDHSWTFIVRSVCWVIPDFWFRYPLELRKDKPTKEKVSFSFLYYFWLSY